MSKKIPQVVKKIKNYQAPEIDYRYQKTISYSQFSVYESCPHRWNLQYKEGYDAPSFSIHTVFGTALHEAIQHYLDIMFEKSGAEADRFDIEEYFKEKFIEEYKSAFKSNKNVHFSSPEEMREFHDDGLEIIKYLKKNRKSYFGKKGWYLAGCEVPIVIAPFPQFKNVIYKGYLDVVMYHEPTDTFKIYDIKTSTRGWSDYEKKNEIKQYQLILYKEFLSKQFGIDPDKIEIEFLITKRKLMEESAFPQKRFQTFSPASGKVKRKQAVEKVSSFINEVFDHSGKHKEQQFEARPSKWTCTFCPFLGKKDLCDKGIVS